MEYILKGFAIGFAVAAPVGPVGLLCIRRSIRDGRLAGFVTGLGAATADAVFGLIAAVGLTSVTVFLASHATGFQLAGGLCLLVIGTATVRSQPHPRVRTPEHAPNLPAAYASTIFITLANPMTMAGFIGIFSGFGIGIAATRSAQIFWLVSGIFLGSGAWWLLLSGCASWFGKKIPDGGLHAINIGAGLAIVLIGLWDLALLAFKIT
ncbi:MAG: LysE family transporter [Opitutaceae bacterium]|jgi:threonine/homoserine/homoserine lactone efflux protein